MVFNFQRLRITGLSEEQVGDYTCRNPDGSAGILYDYAFLS